MASLRHRLFACERCSRRKQRCDKTLPICLPCRDAGAACHGSDRESGVVQLSDGETARKGYVTTLQERIAALEEEAMRRGLLCDIDTPFHEQHVAANTVHAVASDSAVDLSSSNMNMSSLSLSAMAEPRNRAGEFLKYLSTSRIIAGMTETYGGNPEVTARVDSLWDGIAKYIRNPLSHGHRLHVQRDEATRALEIYLEIVDFRFPRLPVDKVRAGIEAITASDDAAYRTVLSKDPAHIFMAYMVIAIVPLVSEDYPISQGSFVSIHLLAKCMKVLDRVFGQEDGVNIIQCLHLLVIFSIHSSVAGSAWHLIGFAMNKCIALGYHREPGPSSAASSPTAADESQQIRWAFWGCYLLDRLLCAALGRPFSIHDRYITVCLPGQQDGDGAAATSLSTKEAFHIHLFRYAQLLSLAVSDTDWNQQSFDQYLGPILQWRNTTPDSTGYLSGRQAYLHQTSLFNTGLLRIAIQDILCSYSFQDPSMPGSSITTVLHIEEEESGNRGGVNEIGQTRHLPRLESQRVKQLKLLDICRAVARSLDRSRMTSRHYLSLTTGFSALSMALATLYCQVVFFRELGQPARVSQDVTGSTLLGTTPTRSFSFQLSSATPYTAQSNESQRMEPNEILDTAYRKLDIVGRQFPLMLEYRQMVQSLWQLVNETEPRDRNNPGNTLSDRTEVNDLKTRAMKMGPQHLRQLTEAILFWL